MNGNTFRNLEFDAVRSLLLDQAGSARGRAWVEALAPSTDLGAVRQELEATTEAVHLLEGLGRQPYHDLPDLDETLSVARLAGAHLEPRALLDVASFVEGGCEIARRVTLAEGAAALSRLASGVGDLTGLAAAIRRAIQPDGELADDASPKLRETRRRLARLRTSLHSVMESFLRDRDADRVLQDKVITTRNDRFVLILKAEQRGQLPGIVHGSSGSGASLFVEPMPAVELNNDIVALTEEERAEVIRILRELTSLVGESAETLDHALGVLGELDALQARALLARDMDASAPEMVAWAPLEGSPVPAEAPAAALDLRDARHPLLDPRLCERLGVPRRSSREPVPVSLRVGDGSTVLVISGPNTGGKTVALKTVGLLALMAQSGLHVPAAPGSRLPVFRSLFADIGDEQSIAANLSTFSAHLAAIVEMTRDLDLPALVLLDEVGAGTDPAEGGALGVAIVDHFRGRGSLVVATTHHGLLKAYAQSTPGVTCASFGYDPESFEPTYRLSLGKPGRSLALEMSERLGLPATVVQDARGRLDAKEAQAEALLKTLEEERAALDREARRQAEERRELAEDRERLAEAEREIGARKRSAAEAFARQLRQKADEASRQAEEAIREAVARLEASRRVPTSAGVERARRGAVQAVRAAHARALEDPDLGLAPDPPAPGAPLAVGSRVRVGAIGVVGEVLTLHGGEVELAAGGKRMKIPASACTPLGAPVRAPRPAPPAAVVKAAPGEINLVGLTVDEALPRVDKLLDDAFLSERAEIRVIHGFGRGTLRKAVAGLLKDHPHVAGFRAGGPGEGGGGVTVVELKS